MTWRGDARLRVNLFPGDSVEVSQILRNDAYGRGRLKKSVYEVLQVFPHFVLCRSVKGGYRECFTWHQLYEGRVIDREELERKAYFGSFPLAVIES